MSIPILHSDVLVIGAGVAGIAAAYGAAERGASVVLLEKYGFLGGLASSAWVGTICGGYLLRTNLKEDPLHYGVGTFPKYFIEKVREASPLIQPIRLDNGVAYLPTTPVIMDAVSRNCCTHPLINVQTHATAYRVDTNNGSIELVHTLCCSEHKQFKASSIIDTTGESLVSKLAEFKTKPITQSQACSLSVVLDTGTATLDKKQFSREVALTAMRLNSTTRASVLPDASSSNKVLLKITQGITPATHSDVIGQENALRKFTELLVETLRKEVAGCKQVLISELTPQLGIRIGNRPVGKRELSSSEVLNGVVCADGIANGCWPIEQWHQDGTVTLRHIGGEGFYQVPADTLISASCKNLWFAGRSFSADEDALASARVIATALGTGYAAGYLAAASALGSSTETAITEIRRKQCL